MIKKWKTAGKKTVYSGKSFSVTNDKVVLPSGRKIDFTVINYPDTVSILALNKKKIIMIRQYRHPIGAVSLELPAGTVEKGELPEQTAKRELEEETGFRAKKIKKLFRFSPFVGRMSNSTHIFIATGLEKTGTNWDEDEFMDIIEISAKDALKKVMDGEITQSTSIIGVLYAHEKRLI